jgi:hypothetical protein
MTLSNKLHYHFLGLALATLLLATPVEAVEPSLMFTPSTLNTQGDSEIIVSIMLNTGGQGVSGAGARIVFDPYFLSAIRVQPGEIFADYPAAIIDNQNGKITVSGIASSPTDQYNGEGTFADIVFRPYHAGTSKVNFEFTPGSTTDSNIAVMTGNGDILAKVNEFSLNSTDVESSISTSPSPSAASSYISPLSLSQNNTVKTIASTLGLSKVMDQYASARPGRSAVTEPVLDPLAPLVRQDPITDPSTTQPIASTSNVARSSFPTYLVPLLVTLILILAGVILWFIISRRHTAQALPPTVSYPPITPPTLTPPPTVT